jgi:hypothetical protein
MGLAGQLTRTDRRFSRRLPWAQRTDSAIHFGDLKLRPTQSQVGPLRAGPILAAARAAAVFRAKIESARFRRPWRVDVGGDVGFGCARASAHSSLQTQWLTPPAETISVARRQDLNVALRRWRIYCRKYAFASASSGRMLSASLPSAAS